MIVFSKVSSAIKKDPSIIFFSLLALFIFAYVLTRAANVSVVHDEGFSFLNYVYNSTLWQTYSFKIPLLNNHLLNSFLMEVSGKIFGYNEITVRLPNLISFGIYLTAGILILRRLKSRVLAVLAFMFLALNPFLLDLAGLARGYGLGNGLMIGGLYFIIKSLEKGTERKKIYLSIGFIFSALSVIANFSFLNFYLGLLATYLLIILFRNRKNIKNMFRESLIPVTVTIGLLAFIAYPLYVLKKEANLGFGGTIGIVEDTVRSLAEAFFYSHPQDVVFINAISIIAGVSIVLGIALWIYKIYKSFKSGNFNYIYILITGIFIFTNLSIVSQKLLLGNLYPYERAAIFYFPLYVLFLIFSIREVIALINRKYFKLSVYAVLSLIAFGFVINFVANYNLKSTYVWPYDANTKEMMLAMKEKIGNTDEKITLGVSWIFDPAVNFYKVIYNMKNLNIVFIEAKVDNTYDYYYYSEYYKDRYGLKIPEVESYEVVEKFEETNSILIKNNK